MMLSSHLFIMLLGEVLVRLHNTENANSKIRIDSTLLNTSLYWEKTSRLNTDVLLPVLQIA